MKPAFWARRAHKWIALIVGAQAFLWMLSGLYMTVISLDIIHGDHLAHVRSEPLRIGTLSPDQATLLRRYPGVTGFKLKQFMGQTVYEIRQGDQIALVDTAGTKLSPLGEDRVRALATSLYQGQAPIQSVELLQNAPKEVANRRAPLWQVNFSDQAQTSLYLSPFTGELLARRHSLWRWFDFLWMFHIMDYESRTDVNNGLLRTFASIGLLFALSGLWLLLYSFRKRRAVI